MALLASLSYPVGWIYVRRTLAGTGNSHLSMTGGQLLLATVQLAVVTPLFTSAPEGFPLVPLLAVAALGALGTGLAVLIQYGLVAEVGPTTAQMVTYFIPVIATAAGVTLLEVAAVDHARGRGDRPGGGRAHRSGAGRAEGGVRGAGSPRCVARGLPAVGVRGLPAVGARNLLAEGGPARRGASHGGYRPGAPGTSNGRRAGSPRRIARGLPAVATRNLLAEGGPVRRGPSRGACRPGAPGTS